MAAAHGAGQPQQVTAIARQGLWFALFLAVPLTVMGLCGTPLLLALGQQPETVVRTQIYLDAIAWGYVPALLFAALRSVVSALSKPRSVMVIVMVGTVVNIIGNYTLMFGKFGFPALGLAGIGWASVLSLWVMLGLLIGYIFRQPSLRAYGIVQQFPWLEWKPLQVLLQVGLPIGCMMAVETGMFAITSFLMGHLGTIPLAAHQIALQSSALSFNIPLGISFATTIRVGYWFGLRGWAGARLAGWVGIGLGGVTMLLTALLFLGVPRWVVGLYLDVKDPANAAVLDLATRLLGVAAVFQLVDGMQVNASGALRGLQDTRVPLAIAIVAYWGVGLSSGSFLSRRWGWGAVGLWWGLALGLTVAAIVLSLRFYQRTRSGLRGKDVEG